jgi:hypothetical protein
MERMVSLDRCRKVLGQKESISDENLVTLREQLYCFAELIFDVREKRKKSSEKSSDGFMTPFEQAAKSQEDPEVLRERAAIIEFEGNTSRDEAERMAISLSLANERVN